MTKTVGDVALKLYEETGDDKWAEGGAYKALLQAAGAALVAQMGNGAGLEAAMGAMASQLAAGKIDEVVKQIAGDITDDPAQAELIANLLANAMSGGIGAAAGGESGVNAASTMDRYNRQLHTVEKIMIAAYAEELFNSLKKDELCTQLGLCNLTKEQLVGIMTQSVLQNIDNNWKDTLPAEDQFQDDVYKFLINKAYEDGLNLAGYTNENGQALLLFTATEAQKDNPFMFIDNFKDKDYYDFIIVNAIPKGDDKRGLALFLANHAEEVEFWHNLEKALNEYPVDFALETVKEGLSYLASGDEMGNDIADFLQQYLEYTDKYLPDLEKYYNESRGEKTDGEYEHIFAYDKTLPLLLETIYGGSASDEILKDEAKKKLNLYIAVLGAKNIMDATASAGLKKAELEALEEAVEEQAADGLTTAKRQELLNVLHEIESAKNQTNGKLVAPGITIDNLSDAAKATDAADKGGQLTSAGRAAQKHAVDRAVLFQS